MKYFKRNCSSGSHEWTDYGSYLDSGNAQQGEFYAVVISIDCYDGKYSYSCYGNYFEPDEIKEITKEEYRHVVVQLQKVDDVQAQIDAVLKALL